MYTFYRTQKPPRKCRDMMKNSIILFRRHIKGRGGISRKGSRRKLVDLFEYHKKFIFVFFCHVYTNIEYKYPMISLFIYLFVVFPTCHRFTLYKFLIDFKMNSRKFERFEI